MMKEMKKQQIARAQHGDVFRDAETIRIRETMWPEKWGSHLTQAECDEIASKIDAEAKIAYDEEALYVELSANELKLRKEQTGPLGAPCCDSCLEFFFCPEESENRYFNIEVNPAGCCYLGIGTSIDTLVRLHPELHPDLLSIRTEEDGDSWRVSYRVPFSFIRLFFPDFAPAPGKKLRCNFYHCGDDTILPHFLAWNRVETGKFSFHQPDAFGELVFA